MVVEHESQPWDRDEFDLICDWDLDMDVHATDIKERAKTPHCECNKCTEIDANTDTYVSGTFSDYDNIDLQGSQQVSAHQRLLCMSHMFGFVLKDRMYGE